MHPEERPSVPKAPPKLASQYEHPDKDHYFHAITINLIILHEYNLTKLMV